MEKLGFEALFLFLVGDLTQEIQMGSGKSDVSRSNDTTTVSHQNKQLRS